MATRFGKQSSYWFPTRIKPHLHISLTEYATNPATGETSVLAVHITSSKSKQGRKRPAKTPVVILRKDDDKRIAKPSRVVYEMTRIRSIKKLNAKATGAQQLDDKAFKKVIRGLEEYIARMSSKDKLRRFFEAQ